MVFIYFYFQFILILSMNNVVVFCGSSTGYHQKYKNIAKELGAFLTEKKYGLVYGGGKIGLMGIIADEVLKNNGTVLGIIPKLLEKKEVVHQNLSKLMICKTMAERKIAMSVNGDAYLILPGGFGTLDELFEVLTLQQLQIEQKPVGILNIDGYFNGVLQQVDTMITEGFLKPEGKNLLMIGTTIAEVFTKMENYKVPQKLEVTHKIASK